MKKINTIKPHREFDRIIHGGVKVKSTHFSLFGEKSDAGYARVGVAVGKSNGKAVVRVRIKRQVRAMIAKAMDWTAPVNLIIVIRPTYQLGEFATNEQELIASLARIKELLH
ncbi:MAG: ribonuclease P protein component [Candidatus Enteromonas sp.]|nr:ribonuclease P protein component [Candidatus Enteromonas sp.]